MDESDESDEDLSADLVRVETAVQLLVGGGESRPFVPFRLSIYSTAFVSAPSDLNVTVPAEGRSAKYAFSLRATDTLMTGSRTERSTLDVQRAADNVTEYAVLEIAQGSQTVQVVQVPLYVSRMESCGSAAPRWGLPGRRLVGLLCHFLMAGFASNFSPNSFQAVRHGKASGTTKISVRWAPQPGRHSRRRSAARYLSIQEPTVPSGARRSRIRAKPSLTISAVAGLDRCDRYFAIC